MLPAGEPSAAARTFGTAFTGKHRAVVDAEKTTHVVARFVDDPHQLVRGGIVASLVVGNTRELGVDLDHRLQRQPAAGVFEKDARTLVGAGIDVTEAVTYLAH
jgi:hypothetical protein